MAKVVVFLCGAESIIGNVLFRACYHSNSGLESRNL